MAFKALPSPEVLRQLLRYEPDTGKLFWRPRPDSVFSDSGFGGSGGEAARWNGKFADTEAFTADHGSGYLRGGVLGRDMFAHRVIWAIVTGSYPTQHIDHINRDRSDNRWENLREASRAQNNQNTRSAEGATSRYLGVWRDRSRNKWAAAISVDGRKIALGRFYSEELAARAYDAAAIKHYGAFANPNFPQK